MILIIAITTLFTGSAKAQAIKQANIHFITDTVADFNSLIGKFKGQIIYVDIWATWCHPCRAELQQKKDVKAFADFTSKNNITELYICCDKNGNDWKAFINENKLSGYHILVNASLYNDMHARFSYAQTGIIKLKKGFWIPRHMIIDQSGAIVDSLAEHQGSSSVYNKLNKLLSKPVN